MHPQRAVSTAFALAAITFASIASIGAIDGTISGFGGAAARSSRALSSGHTSDPGAIAPRARPRADAANPCADGISDISGTIQACTMITDSLGISSTLLTTTLEIAAGIQDPETGPTTHYSHTVGGQAFWYGLHPGRPWFVAVQAEDFPLKNVRRVGPLQIFGVFVGEAVTFHFECVEEPCDELAPTPTPRPTWVTPTRSPTPTPTDTATPTLETAETPEPTSAAPPPTEPTPDEPTAIPSADPTGGPGETPTPTPTESPAPTAVAPSETPEAPPSATPDPAPTALPEPPTVEPPATDVPPGTEPPPSAGPSLRTIYLPALVRRW